MRMLTFCLLLCSYCLRVALNEKFHLTFIIIISNIYNNVLSFVVIATCSKCQPLDCTRAATCTIPCLHACQWHFVYDLVQPLMKNSDGFKFGDCGPSHHSASSFHLPSWFIHSLVFSLEGQAWQEPEPSHVTGMALVHCILGKFLGVVCHCFPLPLDVTTLAARCLCPQRCKRS